MTAISVIIPVYREDPSRLAAVLDALLAVPLGNYELNEVLIVDDGSQPPLPQSLAQAPVRLLRHPRNLGNGAAIKTGARAARSEILVFMDGDGQHDPADLPRILARFSEGYDMVVGARNPGAHASLGRRVANSFYNRLASGMTGYRIDDLTSGFRAARARRFRQFLYLLPNGFSYPTTSTMAFFRSAYSVAYVPIAVRQRHGSSKIKLLKDGMRFFIIIIKVGALFSPMRLFLPVSLTFFVAGLVRYAYTFMTQHRFTNMSAVLFVAAMFTLLIGLVSEQVSALHYKDAERDHESFPEGAPQAALSSEPNTSQEWPSAKARQVPGVTPDDAPPR